MGVQTPKKIDATLCVNSSEGLDLQNNSRDPMRQFLGGSRPPKKVIRPYAPILAGVQTPKIIDATLCVNSWGGLDPQKN